ncbi:hypothetical protein LXL04_018841 [Taraxacum kok-saghyz]
MAYNQQSNERPATSCCEKIHEAIFGKSKRNDVRNPPSFSTVDRPSDKPHVSSVPHEVKTSKESEHSYSNHGEGDSFSDTIHGPRNQNSIKLIPRPRVEIAGMN